MTPPNIVIVMTDQLSPFATAAYGHPVAKTPHLERVARQGIRFDAAYSSSPLCTPARYAFMTGQFVSRCGGFDNAAYMPSTQPTFAHYLRLMGYRTELAGKMHFVGPDQLHGFEARHTTDIYPADFGWVPDWTAPEKRIDLWYHNMSSVVQAGPVAISNQLAFDDEVGAAALRAIYDHARSTDIRPLCLVASFVHPHDPYAARQSFWDLYEGIAIPAPSVPRPSAEDDDAHSRRLRTVMALDAVDVTSAHVNAARRAYLANVSYVDHWLGRLLDALTECRLIDNTVVVFLSDHGDMLGERGLWYKMSFYEWSVRIPLIIWAPQRFDPKVVGTPVSQVDILPTLMALASDNYRASMPQPLNHLDGSDLIALAEQNDSADARVVVSEYLAEGTGQPMLMLRKGHLKYTVCPGDPEQLFDLDEDPDERRNLAAMSSASAQLETFRGIASAHWDIDGVRNAVLASQRQRRVLSQALRKGAYQSWDWQPIQDAATQYVRSHLDLTERETHARYPRPQPFRPRWQ